MDKKRIVGAKIWDLLSHPHEAVIALETIAEALDSQTAMYCTYDVGGMQFLGIVFPSKPANGLVAEIHECPVIGKGGMQRAAHLLGKLCKRFWQGPGCQWQGRMEA